MKMIVSKVGEPVPTLSHDWREYAVELRVDDVWCEESDGVRTWVKETFGDRTRPEFWPEGNGEKGNGIGCVTFVARLPARSEAELRGLLSQVQPFETIAEPA